MYTNLNKLKHKEEWNNIYNNVRNWKSHKKHLLQVIAAQFSKVLYHTIPPPIQQVIKNDFFAEIQRHLHPPFLTAIQMHLVTGSQHPFMLFLQ